MVLGGVAGIVLTASLLTVLWWPRSEVVHRDRAPSTVTYDDRSKHYVGLIRQHTLSGRESYRLTIGRDPGLSYGHSLDIDTSLGADGIKATEWTTTGVRVRFATGHDVFVPARLFMFGR
ncbi:hypothetical protein [Streptomyces sp. 8N706]|uniref:hypothetical protein n=1 Tax=Streptomyces sp. 8N706 TaxID=3457416 RepID=UPI003FD6A420